MDGAEVWAVPFGNYVLAACNADFILRNNVLFDSLKEALPMISRVVGGEAVLFDNHGRRLYSVDYDGKTNEAFIGKISAAAQKAMATGKPFIGDSLSAVSYTHLDVYKRQPYGQYVITILTKDFADKQYHKEHESTIYGARVSRLLFDQYMALEGRFKL